MNGLRATGLFAGAAGLFGAFAITLVTTVFTTAPRQPAGGATFAVVERRLVVTSLRTRGAEASAGLQVGDVIEAANGIATPSLTELTREEARGAVALRIRRRGDVMPVILLSAMPGGQT